MWVEVFPKGGRGPGNWLGELEEGGPLSEDELVQAGPRGQRTGHRGADEKTLLEKEASHYRFSPRVAG